VILQSPPCLQFPYLDHRSITVAFHVDGIVGLGDVGYQEPVSRSARANPDGVLECTNLIVMGN
jgi:hypothetical protein